MIQDKPVCFGCENVIDDPQQVVYAPPFDEEGYRQVSACFHGLCLMEWREKRDGIRARMRQAHEAFLRHLTGECGCDD